MPTKSETIENLNWITERISNRVWAVSLAVLATCVGYVIESSKNEQPFLEPQIVAIPAALALVSLMSDLIQYIAANRQNVRLLQKLEKSGLDAETYDTTDPWFKLRRASYVVKIFACILSAIVLILLTTIQALKVIEGSFL